MDRREFLKTTGGAAAAAAAASTAAADTGSALSAPATASGIKELRLAMPWPDDGRGFGDTARRLARRIEQATSGRYRVSIAETGKSASAALGDGEADLYHGSVQNEVGAHPGYAFFAGLPMAESLSPVELETWLLVGNGQALWDELAAEQGIKSLLAGHTGPMMVWSPEAFDSLADWAGRKVLVSGLAADVVRGIGAEPITLAPHEVKSALAEGHIQAAAYGGLIAAMSLGVPEVAPRALASSLGAAGTALSLSLSRRFWDSLLESDKAAFTSAAAEEFRVTVAEERTHREPISIALRARHKVEMTSPAADLRDALSRVGTAVVAHAAGYDARSTRINASYMAFRASSGQAVA